MTSIALIYPKTFGYFDPCGEGYAREGPWAWSVLWDHGPYSLVQIAKIIAKQGRMLVASVETRPAEYHVGEVEGRPAKYISLFDYLDSLPKPSPEERAEIANLCDKEVDNIILQYVLRDLKSTS